MAVTWKSSAGRHGVPREDAVYAIAHHEVSAEINGEPGETTMVCIGHPHSRTDRYLEVIAVLRPPHSIEILHVMSLTDLYRHLLYEGE